jgi:hypothetical protein
MNEKLKDRISKYMDSLLNEANSQQDIKILVRWIKILVSLFFKEIKNDDSSEAIELLYEVVINLGERLLEILDSSDEEELYFFGPMIYEVLLKVKTVIIEMDHYVLANNNSIEDNFQLSDTEKDKIASLFPSH